jgi:hypothetical protein
MRLTRVRRSRPLGQVTDMTPSNSSRNTRPAAQMLKLDGQVFEIAYPKASAFIPGLAAPPDGLARETEYVVRVTGASGAGGLNRGLLIEIEWFPLPAELAGDDDGSEDETADQRLERQKEALQRFLRSLLSPADGVRTQATTAAVTGGGGGGARDDVRAVDRGRTSARLLLGLLKAEGLI